MYLVIYHKTSLLFVYLHRRFENHIQLIVLLPNDIKYLSFAINDVGDIQFIKYLIRLHISAIPHATNKLTIC
jgi:hypothetical protein